MSDNTKTIINVNLSFTIFLVLLILKLSDTVAWSWWIITLPLYLPVALFLVAMGVLVVAGLIVGTCISISSSNDED